MAKLICIGLLESAVMLILKHLNRPLFWEYIVISLLSITTPIVSTRRYGNQSLINSKQYLYSHFKYAFKVELIITIALVSVATRLQTTERGSEVHFFKSTFDGNVVDVVNAMLPLLLITFRSQAWLFPMKRSNQNKQ